MFFQLFGRRAPQELTDEHEEDTSNDEIPADRSGSGSPEAAALTEQDMLTSRNDLPTLGRSVLEGEAGVELLYTKNTPPTILDQPSEGDQHEETNEKIYTKRFRCDVTDDSESDEERRRQRNGIGSGVTSGSKRLARSASTSTSGSSLSSTTNSCYASSYERRREDRERLEEGVNLVLSDDDFIELTATLRVPEPILPISSVFTQDRAACVWTSCGRLLRGQWRVFDCKRLLAATREGANTAETAFCTRLVRPICFIFL